MDQNSAMNVSSPITSPSKMANRIRSEVAGSSLREDEMENTSEPETDKNLSTYDKFLPLYEAWASNESTGKVSKAHNQVIIEKALNIQKTRYYELVKQWKIEKMASVPMNVEDETENFETRSMTGTHGPH